MTDEIKKLIESVKVYQHPVPLCFDSIARALVEKSDFDRVVEELIKWHKVEDKLPEEQGHYFVRVKNSFPKNCNVVVAEFYDDNNIFYSESSDEPIKDAIEWKPII